MQDGMNRRVFAVAALSLQMSLLSTGFLLAANMRDFIEAVRRRAPVVYVGVVREVRVLERTKLDIRARATVDVLSIARAPAGAGPKQASVEHSSYDDQTPMMEGGPQYRLQPGLTVLVFANSFKSTVPPGYLLWGGRQDLLRQVETNLRDSLIHMGAETLRANEIMEDDRRVQLALYDKVCADLRSTK
jgi:hypothetical protein